MGTIHLSGICAHRLINVSHQVNGVVISKALLRRLANAKLETGEHQE